MLYFIFGVKNTRGEESKITPITEDIFNPDVQVLNQKIIRLLYPNATNDFIKESIINNEMSPVMLFPSKYIKYGELNTLVDPLVDYSIFSKIGTNVQHQFGSQLFIKEMNDEITNVLQDGFKNISKSGYQFQQNVKNRSINLEGNQSTKVLVALITWKLSINNSMFVTIQPENDETLYDSIVKNLIFFNSTSNKVRFGLKVKMGYLDIQNDDFETLVSFSPILFNIDLSKRTNIRSFQYPEDQFIGNLVDSGINKNAMRTLKKISSNRKQIKFKK